MAKRSKFHYVFSLLFKAHCTLPIYKWAVWRFLHTECANSVHLLNNGMFGEKQFPEYNKDLFVE